MSHTPQLAAVATEPVHVTGLDWTASCKWTSKSSPSGNLPCIQAWSCGCKDIFTLTQYLTTRQAWQHGHDLVVVLKLQSFSLAIIRQHASEPTQD